MNQECRYIHRVLVSISIMSAALIGAPSHMTLSAYARHCEAPWAIDAINWLFDDNMHCWTALQRYRRGGMQ